jgi:hypothetical protein
MSHEKEITSSIGLCKCFLRTIACGWAVCPSLGKKQTSSGLPVVWEAHTDWVCGSGGSLTVITRSAVRDVHKNTSSKVEPRPGLYAVRSSPGESMWCLSHLFFHCPDGKTEAHTGEGTQQSQLQQPYWDIDFIAPSTLSKAFSPTFSACILIQSRLWCPQTQAPVTDRYNSNWVALRSLPGEEGSELGLATQAAIIIRFWLLQSLSVQPPSLPTPLLASRCTPPPAQIKERYLNINITSGNQEEKNHSTGKWTHINRVMTEKYNSLNAYLPSLMYTRKMKIITLYLIGQQKSQTLKTVEDAVTQWECTMVECMCQQSGSSC